MLGSFILNAVMLSVTFVHCDYANVVMLSVVLLNCVILSVVLGKCCYAECRSDKWHYAECLYIEFLSCCAAMLNVVVPNVVLLHANMLNV